MTRFENKKMLDFDKIVSLSNSVLLGISVLFIGIYWFLAVINTPSEIWVWIIFILTFVIAGIFITSYILKFRKVHNTSNTSLKQKTLIIIISTIIEISFLVLIINPEIYFYMLEMLVY